jgi:sulfur carrier protein
MIKINGCNINADELSLSYYLEANGYNKKRIAVECNEEIVPRSEYDAFILHSGDEVEIVSLVGGG